MKTNTPEGIQARIAVLEVERAALKWELQGESNPVVISEKKRRKLAIKDEIVRLEHELAKLQRPLAPVTQLTFALKVGDEVAVRKVAAG